MEDIVIWVYMEYMENAHKKHAHCTIEYGIPIESDSNYGEKRTKIWSESLIAVSLWA